MDRETYNRATELFDQIEYLETRFDSLNSLSINTVNFSSIDSNGAHAHFRESSDEYMFAPLRKLGLKILEEKLAKARKELKNL